MLETARARLAGQEAEFVPGNTAIPNSVANALNALEPEDVDALKAGLAGSPPRMDDGAVCYSAAIKVVTGAV